MKSSRQVDESSLNWVRAMGVNNGPSAPAKNLTMDPDARSLFESGIFPFLPSEFLLEIMASWLVMVEWSNSFLVACPAVSPSA